MNMQANHRRIISREEGTAPWFDSIIAAGRLARTSSTPGCQILDANGAGLWWHITQIFDREIMGLGYEKRSYPALIRRSLFEKEADHIDGFAPEFAMVERLKGRELEDPLVLRPTSEAVIYEDLAGTLQTAQDLPIRINQWCNVFRVEMRTRPLMRTMEFQWHEAHWAEENVEAAQVHAREALDAYARFLSEQAAIPAVYGEKTQLERFAGAQTTLTAEARMIDGKALQCATSHVMDEGFAAAYGIQYTGKGGTQNTPITGSWGMSTRIIGAIVMTHADEAGMVMPPRLAPTQAVVMTAGFREGLDEDARQAVNILKDELEAKGLRVQLDLRDERIGAKHFKWEKEGVPLRIIVGPREVKAGEAVVVRRDDGSEQMVPFEGAGALVEELLDNVHAGMFKRAQERLRNGTCRIETLEEFEDEIGRTENAFVLAGWSDTPDAERLLKERYGYTVRCIPDEQSMDVSRCFLTGEPTTKTALIAKSY